MTQQPDKANVSARRSQRQISWQSVPAAARHVTSHSVARADVRAGRVVHFPPRPSRIRRFLRELAELLTLVYLAQVGVYEWR